MNYAIMVTDARGGSRIELCRVGSNPEAVADGARRKTYTLNRRQFRMYSRVEIVKLAEGQSC
jgi:hypothetical protein